MLPQCDMTTVLLKEIRRQHRQEHAALDDALRRALAATDDADPRRLQAVWTAFERRLFRHLELEEQSLFPLVERIHPDEVHELCADHGRLRHLAMEIGLGCDLHTLTKLTLSEFATLLTEHAAREDATLDRWLDDAVPSDTRRHLASLFVDMMRAELRPPERHPPAVHAG